MAITENRRMQQLRGKYADLDKSKMLVGEIAVPSDHSPIMKVDTDKYIELVSSEDTEYIEKITAEIEQTLDDVKQLAIDKVGINNTVESDVQTYSSRKIQSMHDEQAESITNQITDQFKVLSGTSVVASDSSSGYATDFSCDGKVEQKQYSGVNMCSLVDKASTTSNGVTYSCNNQLVSASGTSTGNADIGVNFAKNITFEAGKSYTISLQGNFTHSANINAYFFNVSTNAYNTPFGIDSTNVRTFTFNETITTSGILIRGFSGNTISGSFKVQIEEGTTATDYEKFVGGTPSPNPDYPQAIDNSGDCVEMVQGYYAVNSGVYATSNAYVCNGNQIPCKSGDVLAIKVNENIANVHFLWYGESGYKSYITATVTDSIATATVPSGATYFNYDLVGVNGSSGTLLLANVGKIELTINNKYVLQVKSASKNLIEDTIKVADRLQQIYVDLPAGTYTLSALVTSSDTDATTSFVYVFDENGTELKPPLMFSRGVRESKTFASDKPIKRLAFYSANWDNGTGDSATYSQVQLECGSVATEFVPHKEHISTILLDEPTRAVNDVKDIIEYVNDGYKVRRKIKTRVFNGSEGWVTSTPTKSGLYRYDVYVSDTSRKTYSAMCSHFIMSKATTSFADNVTEVSFAVHPTNGNFCFFTEFATVDEFKAWLTSNPITVQYEMAEEVIEDIADQTPFYQIQTFDGGTTISTTDRLQPQIEVEYPTNRVAGVASEGYAKASALSDKILTYQLRDIPGDVLGALFSVKLPDGVDGRNCTVVTSYCVTPTKYSEMDAGYPWYYGGNFNTYTGDNGVVSTISGYITEATSGYAHVNVTVIRNDI